MSRLPVLTLALLILACEDDGSRLLGDYPFAAFNGNPAPSIYHATLNCDELVDSGNLRITDAGVVLTLSIRQDCTRAGGSNSLSPWPYSSTGVYSAGTMLVTLAQAPADTVRLLGTYGGGFVELTSQAELLPALSGVFSFGPRAPLP